MLNEPIMKTFFSILLMLVTLPIYGKSPNGQVEFKDISTDTITVDTIDVRHIGGCILGHPFHNDSYPHFTLFSGGVFVGIGPSMGCHGTTFEAGMLNIIGLAYYTSHHNQRLSVGLGFSMRGLYTHSGQCLQRQEDRTASQVIDGAQKDKTEINIPSLLLPMLYRQRIHGRLNAYGGVIARLNLGCKADSHWSIKNARRVNVDLTAGIDCIWMGAYVKYTPMSDIKGLSEFCHVLTLGATLAF